MRALQLVAPTVVELVDVPVPEIGVDDVLLRVAGAGVCHSDLHVVHAAKPMFRLPTTLGHEVAGIVATVGDGVRGWHEGAAAVVHLCWSCGHCRACVAGNDNVCERAGRRALPPTPGLGPDGGMAEFMRVPARYLVGIGDLDPVAAAPLADAATTSYHAIRNTRHILVPGTTAVVIGVGGLGHVAVQLLRATTAARVVVIDVSEQKLTHAVDLGADDVVLAGPAAADAVLTTTGGLGAAAIFDFVGSDASLRTAAEAVAPNGIVHVSGIAGGRWDFAAEPRDGTGWPWGASLRTSYAGTRSDLVECVALARAGRIAVDVDTFSLDDGVDAFAKLAAGEVAGRAVLVP